jgi:hypothetical protein
MSIIPRIKLYDSAGTTLLYTFTAVQDTNIPLEEIRSSKITPYRGRGAIVLTGSVKDSDIYVSGILDAADYEALVVLMDSMKSTIVKGTKYILKMDKSSSGQYSYNVKMVDDISMPIDEDKRNTYQNYKCTFISNAW